MDLFILFNDLKMLLELGYSFLIFKLKYVFKFVCKYLRVFGIYLVYKLIFIVCGNVWNRGYIYGCFL